MTDNDEHPGGEHGSPRRPGLEAGFDATRRELEEMASSTVSGVVGDPTLVSNAGLWVTFLGREPCCGARVLLNVRTLDGLDGDTIDEIFDEASRGRDLRHPNVLSIRRFGRTDDAIWITTRAYRGRLLRLPRPAAAAGSPRAVEFLRRVAGPLEAVHRDGLVHGALGEASFHCDTEDRIRIRHLGLDVPLVRSLFEAGIETDTVASTAPEVLAGSRPQAESDQYALAGLLVRAMTGHTPGFGDEVEWQVIPGRMRGPLRRALETDPDKRFSSILDLWEALDPEGAKRRLRSRATAFVGPHPDAEVPGAPRADGPRGDDVFGPAAASAPTPAQGHGAPEGRPVAPPPRRRGVASSRRSRRRRARGAGPWSRTFAAAAVLVLFFGTVELVGEWDRFSPFPTSPDSATLMAGADETPADTRAPGTELAMPEPTPETSWSDDEAPDTSATTAFAPEPDSLAPEQTSNGDEPDSTAAAGSSTSAPPRSSSPSATPSVGSEAQLRAEQAPGLLYLHSYPWGEVYLDGDYVGNSPIVGLRVSAGEHRIRIERAGYEPHVETITVRSGQLVERTGIRLRSEETR